MSTLLLMLPLMQSAYTRSAPRLARRGTTVANDARGAKGWRLAMQYKHEPLDTAALVAKIVRDSHYWSPEIIPAKVILPLLDHPAPMVREGVIYGLTPHLDESMRAKLEDIAEHDTSPGVREAARGALKDLLELEADTAG